jgi:hypothetical protein
MAEGCVQPIRFDKGKSIDLTKEFGSSLGEAFPDRLIAILEVQFCLSLIPPTFSPSQRCTAAGEPHLAA